MKVYASYNQGYSSDPEIKKIKDNQSKLQEFFNECFHGQYDENSAEQHYRNVLEEYVDPKYKQIANEKVLDFDGLLHHRLAQHKKYKSITIDFQNMDCYMSHTGKTHIYTYHKATVVDKSTNKVSYGYVFAKFTMKYGKILECKELVLTQDQISSDNMGNMTE